MNLSRNDKWRPKMTSVGRQLFVRVSVVRLFWDAPKKRMLLIKGLSLKRWFGEALAFSQD